MFFSSLLFWIAERKKRNILDSKSLTSPSFLCCDLELKGCRFSSYYQSLLPYVFSDLDSGISGKISLSSSLFLVMKDIRICFKFWIVKVLYKFLVVWEGWYTSYDSFFHWLQPFKKWIHQAGNIYACVYMI